MKGALNVHDRADQKAAAFQKSGGLMKLAQRLDQALRLRSIIFSIIGPRISSMA